MQPKDTVLDKIIADDVKRGPSADKLEFVRDQVKYIRDLHKRIEDAEEIVKSLRNEKRELEFVTLPTLFMQNKITAISLAPEGNMPGYEAEIRDYYHANINAKWLPERKQAALDWLQKHKLGDIIKTVITIELGLGQSKVTTKLLAAIRTLKIPFTKQQSVPWNTLTAVVREMYQDGKPLKDSELNMLGAQVGKIVTLQPKKEKL
jgi:hypothetical protein